MLAKMKKEEPVAQEDLIREFGPELAGNADVMEELVHMSHRYSLSAEVLASKWEQLVLRGSKEEEQSSSNIPTRKQLEELRNVLNRDLERKAHDALGFPSGSNPMVKVLSERNIYPPDGSKFFNKDTLQALLDEEEKLPPKTPLPKGKVRVRGDGGGLPSSASSRIKAEPGLYTPMSKAGGFARDFPKSSPAGPPSSSPVGKLLFNPSTAQTSSPGTAAANFANRTNAGRIEDVFNPSIPFKRPHPSAPVLRQVSTLHHQQMDGYRYMFEKLAQIGDLIDERIDSMAEIIHDHLKQHDLKPLATDSIDETGEGQQESLLKPPWLISEEPFFTIGRVCLDSIEEDARLNGESILLEPSRAIGSGDPVRLSPQELLEKEQPVALFPGQILGVLGTNPTGKELRAKKLFLPPRLPFAATPVTRILKHYPVGDEAAALPMNVFIASGPFALDDTLAYEPLKALTQVVCDEKPDVVVLLGPFVDSAHPLLLQSPLSDEDIFKQVISPMLQSMLDSRPNLTLVLIPSTRDFTTLWVGYPQPPFAAVVKGMDPLEERRLLGLDLNCKNGSNLVLLPNPTQFYINEILFAISTADSLTHIGNQEWARVPRKDQEAEDGVFVQDRISRLFSHMLSQRHLYPLSPPYFSEHFSVDQTRLNSGAVTLQATPDVLVIPSLMRHCVKTVGGCLCINPGHATKKKAGGTFARLCVHPMPSDKLLAFYKSKKGGDVIMKMEEDSLEAGDDEDEVTIPHGVSQRTRVEIIRI
ncbi:DNA-directed DNA polymerase alpha subunit pol12 [Phlyctochytrium bullatum]|nr:DNA-directed DNA polymerase alpha subunit pol12 [Phlyctochytrium bullatum]